MGYASGNQKVTGCFREKDHRLAFEYVNEVDEWGKSIGATHTVFVGHGEVRYGKVLKTVAYICIDEDENGDPVWDKWFIKTMWRNE